VSLPEAETNAEPAIVAARAAVLAEIDANGAGIAPTLRPLTLNTANFLAPPSAPVAATIEARVRAGYPPEGDQYPTSRTWSRVVVPAIAVGALDVPAVIAAGICTAIHVHLSWIFFLASLVVLFGSAAVALLASYTPLHDPLRLSTSDRRELNQLRTWQSRQPWMGPRSSTPQYRLFAVAHATVQRLANSPAWASPYLDEHRLRLNLAHELDGIDQQACQLAAVAEQSANTADTAPAWTALLDRVARLRHYADGVIALESHLARLESTADNYRLDANLGSVAVGSALDEFAAEHVRALSADLERLRAAGSRPF
jgi:hypothetical protein